MKFADLSFLKSKALIMFSHSVVLLSLLFGLAKEIRQFESIVMAPLSISVTTTPTIGIRGMEITYDVTITGAVDTHTLIQVNGIVPTHTQIVGGSVVNFSGRPASIPNTSLPEWSIDTLSSSKFNAISTRVRYRVLVNTDANSPIENIITVRSLNNGLNTEISQNVSTPLLIQTLRQQGLCRCNNDNTPNVNNGTYNARLVIRNDSLAPPGPAPLSPGLNFTLVSSTNVSTPIGSTFLYQNGTYYMDVTVTGPMFTVRVDGPDLNPDAELVFDGTCSGYQVIDYPDTLSNGVICVLPTEIINIPISGIFSLNYPFTNTNPPILPDGFSYSVIGGQLNLSINGAEIDPQESPFNLYYLQFGLADPNALLAELVNVALTGNINNLVNNFLNAVCYTTSVESVSVALRNVAVINQTHFPCVRPGAPIYLSRILGEGNTNPDGFFTVTPDGGAEFTVAADTTFPAPAVGTCYSVTYTIEDDECGDVTSAPVNVLITTKPALPEFTVNGVQRPAPICATTSQDIMLSAPSANESYFIPASSGGNLVGNILTLPAPTLAMAGEPVSIKYTICKATSGGPVPACTGTFPIAPAVCRDTLCKTLVLYNDGYNCGDDALFPSTCGEPFRPDVCFANAKPGLELGCRWFSISTPPIMSAEIAFNDVAVNCTEEEVCGTYNVSFFGVNADNSGSGATIGSFPGIGTICRVLNFKIFGIRPLGAIANLLGCNKTIAQFILDLLGTLVGGDGGQVLVRVDTDGDGAFDVTGARDAFPSGGTFCVPNRVAGQGYITARAIGTWPSGIPDECGNLAAGEISLLDLLPIGAIPIVGPTIEDILNTAGCDVFLEFSAVADAEVIVSASQPASFANCDTTTRVLYTYTGQSTTCVLPAGLWNIPVAYTSCENELLSYKGVLPLDSIREEGVYQTAGPAPGSILIPGDTMVTFTAVSCNGNYSSCTFVLRIIEADPSFEAGFMCCTEQSVFLGGAGWDGIGAPPIANTIRLDAIRGRYPVTMGGRWTGQGVEFYNPDGIPFNGDEYYLYNPTGLDGPYTLTYTLDGQPCDISFSRDITVTCQDLQVALTDQVTCPAVWVPERIIIVDLGDDSITVTTSGLSNIGDAGGHYGGGPILDPVTELIDTIANDGRVVVPGFFAPAIRDTTFTVCVRVYQRNSPFGCEDLFCYDIRVVDTIAPVFLNCPTEPIVVDALLGQCEAFVNFPFPIASDSCQGFTRVTQVDTTGLKSGDLFPVGLTVLAYSTIDTVGNQNYCEIKIIVQDFRLPPRVQCPPNVALRPNDLNVCGAIVNNIAPVSITDNCRDHVAVTYEVTGPNGEQVACGFENASGTLFPIGTSTVKYTVKDQPLILITEVQQRDSFYGVEITNFGPSAVDITCGKFMLKDENGNVIETFTIPTDNNISTMFERPIYPPVIPILWNVRTPNNILDVGETFTHVFDGDQDGDGDVDVVNNYDRCNVRKYCFGFLDYVMDEAVVNDDLDASVILRNTVCDKDLQSDFRAANPCDTASFGVLNSGLPIMTFRNDTVGLQHIAPSFDMCTFTVSVEDTEAPTCIWHDSIRVAGSSGLPLLPNLCLSDTVVMPAGLVDDINIFNLNITTSNAGAIGVYLRGPSGKRIKLFDRICATDTLFCTGGADSIAGNPNININLDETINKWQTAPLINTALCDPTGQGGTYRPEKSFKEFYGSQGAGNWILEIYGEEGVTGTLVSWDLEILYQIPFGQQDTTMVNSTGLCDTVFTWIHPILEDNCMFGKMQVEYLFSNMVTGVSDTVTVIIKDSMNTVNMMGCTETRRFRVGTTEVRYSLMDNYGNTSRCSFKVIVNDTENPVFVPNTCYDRQIFLDPGECVGVLINPPQATDNCEMDTITYCFLNAMGGDSLPANIEALPIGDYMLVAKAEDIYGNIERCPFRVVVIEFIPTSIELACINNVNLSLDASCVAEVTPSMILADVSNVRCYDNYDIIVLDEKGNPRSPVFTKADEGKSFKVIITDNEPPRVAPFNSCWGYIHIERKLGPTMLCARDTTVFCNTDANAKTAQGKYVLGEPLLTSCENKVTVWHQDEWVSYGNCDSIRALLIRTWFLENDKGERISCVQNVKFRRMHLDSITFPADVKNLVCVDVERNASLLHPDNTGWPSLHGMKVNRVGGLCMVSLLYTDERFEICYGSYEILRTWKVRDMCGPVTSTNPKSYVQIIKVNANDGPIINDCPADITVTVDAWECLYNGQLPVPRDIDAICSPNYGFQARIIGGGRVFSSIDGNLKLSVRASNLRKGTYTIVYDFKDLCLNTSQCSFNVTVVDSIAPVATAKEFITVSLTKNEANASEDGVAKVFAHQVDNGSYDNCGPIYLEVRRDDGAPACLNTGNLWNHDNNSSTADIPYNNNVTYNARTNGLDQSNPLHLNDSEFDTDKGQFVKFCCEDIGKEVKVWLRVWDDASGDGIFGNAGDNFNETWAMVKVEDKVVPKLYCIPAIELACDRDTGNITEYNFTTSWVDANGKVPASVQPIAEGICSNYELEFRDAGSLTACNNGTFTRTYRVKGFTSVSCTQVITVRNFDADPALEWPIVLHEWNQCTLTEDDVLNNTVRARLNVERELDYEGCYNTIMSNINPQNGVNICSADQFRDLCKLGSAVGRHEDPKLPYNVIPDNNTGNCGTSYFGGRPEPLTTNGVTPLGLPRFNSDYKDPGCNVYGKKITIEEYTVGEGCKKWFVKFDYINWCCNEKSACRETIYKYEDTVAPEIVVCPSIDTDILNNLCNADIVLSPVATDDGGCEEGLTWRIRIFKDIANPSLEQSKNASLYTEFSTTNGLTSGQQLKGNNPTFTHPQGLPPGIHGVIYLVTDGCGNVRECRAQLAIWPKPATPYCVALSSAIMKNGLVELWAKDFDRGSFTNCGKGVMLFTFDRLGQPEHPNHENITIEHYYRGFGELLAVPGVSNNTDLNNALALYNEGKAQRWLPEVTRRPRPALANGTPDPRGDELTLIGGTSGMQFGCKAGDTIGTALEIRMRVWDYRSFKSGETTGSDFCKSTLSLIDNQGGCGAQTLIAIGGTIATEVAKPMKNVGVSLNSLLPEYPINSATDEAGKYLFNNQPIGLEYTLSPSVIADVYDGINTLDLVQIQRHILGIAKLNSPYKMIAADADSDQAIRVNDIVVLRKLILGIEQSLPGGQSWKFVNAKDKMDQSPWPFNEMISHAQLLEPSIDNNFIGVKLGDVDGSALFNFGTKTLKPRQAPLTLSYDNFRLQAGVEYEVELYSSNFNQVHGMQWTMSHAGIEIKEVTGVSIYVESDNIALHNNDKFTFSWSSIDPKSLASDEKVLRIKFVSKVDGKLSDVLKLNSDITYSEAYTGSGMETVGVELEERQGQNPVFALAQNEPNPWKDQTSISYTLPESGTAKFSVYDVTGRMIIEKNLKSIKGENSITISRSDLKGITGMLLYKVEFEGQTSQKKMLIIE